MSSKQTKKFWFEPKQTETRSVSVVFRFVSRNQKQTFRFVSGFVSVFSTYIETTETNRAVSKQTETTLNFLKNTNICSLSNCFGWSSSVSVESKHRNSLFRYRSETTETNCFETNQYKPKPTETTLNLPKKIPKYALCHTVSLALLFVSVQSKHRNSLLRYRNETTETNVLFWGKTSFGCFESKLVSKD